MKPARKVRRRLDRDEEWWKEFTKRASPRQLKGYRKPGSRKKVN